VIVSFDDGDADNHDAALPVLRAHGLPATFFVATGFVDRPSLPWWDEVAWMVRTSAREGVTLAGFLDAPVRFDPPDRQRAIRALLWTYYRLPTDRARELLAALGVEAGTGRFAGPVDGLWMTWDQVRALHAAGMTVGGHTVNHHVLSRLDPERQRAEVLGCARRLEEELGVPMRTFSYPAGQRDSFDEVTRACLREAGVQSAFTYYGGFRRLDDWDALDVPRIAVEQDTTFDEFRALVLAPWRTRA
jgi:peptidoglycan/xylan/chitin deacetylase (PgdA/CDA1 family)